MESNLAGNELRNKRPIGQRADKMGIPQCESEKTSVGFIEEKYERMMSEVEQHG